jgi:DNA-binding CsgD family transcriptional regulator
VSPSLTRVVALLAQGLTAREIGRELRITATSAKTYIRRAAKEVPGPGRPSVRLIRWYMSAKGDMTAAD